jgi:hypothetical protein
MKILLTILAILVAAALSSCSSTVDNKSSEKRILDDINRLADASSKFIRSDELRNASIRLNELGKNFPERRAEIAYEGGIVKKFVSQIIDDEVKIAQKWGELLELPLSEEYRNCVSLQAKSSALTQKRFLILHEEIDFFLDPSVEDKATLETRLEPIRSRAKVLESQEFENEELINRSCHRPNSNPSNK